MGWSDIDACASALAERLPAACGVAAFDRVIGIARGGLIPAVLLASRLGVKRVESIQVRYYDGDTRLDAPTVVGDTPAVCGPSGDPQRTLLVDELVDSGDTLRYLRTIFPEASMATLVARQVAGAPEEEHGLLPWSCGADGAAESRVWVVRSIPTDRWILFPWSPPEDVAAGTANS